MTLIGKIDVYLDSPMLLRQQSGRHNFLNVFHDALSETGAAVAYKARDAAPLVTNEFTLSYRVGPIGQNSVIFRRAYHFPYWYIDVDSERWQWSVARESFDHTAISQSNAQAFTDRNRSRLFPESTGENHGFILVAVRGVLDIRRSFQLCSPLDMIKHAAQAFPDHRVIICLDSNDHYGSGDLASVHGMVAENRNLELGDKAAKYLLPYCHAIVTQDSRLAMSGYLFHKPVILFSKSDIHHIAIDPNLDEPLETAKTLAEHSAQYAAYVYWYWQQKCINAGHPSCKDRIIRSLKRCGWPVDV